jgi:hypothetical protein
MRNRTMNHLRMTLTGLLLLAASPGATEAD